MSTPDTRLGPVTLQIGDLERSLSFYEGVLGLEILARKARYAELGALDGSPLINLSEHPGARPVPRRGRLGLYHVALLLPERAASERFCGMWARRVSVSGWRIISLVRRFT